MRKVIGIGETILDIIFRNGQPTAAVPGGSVFNGVVSLARAGVPVSFISETGNDRVGNTILQSMRDSGMSTDYVNVFPDGKSPVSLAYLNENGDAEYIFYKDYPPAGRGFPKTGRRRHRGFRLLFCPESGAARKGPGFAGTGTREESNRVL